MPDNPPLDPDLLKLASFTVFSIKEAELMAVMIQLGNRLGLFEALHRRGGAVADLAGATGLEERWVTEWLYAVVAAGLVEKDADVFSMTPEMGSILADPEAPGFVGSMFNAPVSQEIIDRLMEAFRSGIGFTWDDHGKSTCHMQTDMNGGRDRHFLVGEVLASVPGLTERLEDGIRVYDVGCGAGDASLAMATAFPRSAFVGLDPSGHAITEARAAARAAGVSNLEFRQGVFDDLSENSADFVLVIDVLHDLPRPTEAIEAVRRALVDDGVWLVGDVSAGETFEDNARNPVLALYYAMSVIYCMNSSLSEPGGAGLGTMGLHPERLRGWTEAAGFTGFEVHRYDHDSSNSYYEVRP